MSEQGFIRRNALRALHTNDSMHVATFDAWRDPDSAPLNKPWRCRARDDAGPYTLPMPCIKTDAGWISATTRTPLHVAIIGWKP